MSRRCFGRFVPSTLVLRIATPLAAAFLAALASHVAIDAAGDFLLAHDTFDDQPHGSRWLASLALGASALAALWLWTRALLAEACGEPGALRAALRASVPASAITFVSMVVAATLPFVAGMAWLDAFCAGAPVDDIVDLYGGSLALGSVITVAFAIAVAASVHRLVALVTRFHRSIVRVVGAFVHALRLALGAAGARPFVCRPQDRPRVPAALARCTGADRAPPETALAI